MAEKNVSRLLDEIKKMAKTDTGARVRGGGIKIDPDFVDALIKTIRERGTGVKLPKEYVEKHFGMNTNTPIKSYKPYQMKSKLNRDFGDMLNKDEIWLVGKRGIDAYAFNIVKVGIETAKRYKE